MLVSSAEYSAICTIVALSSHLLAGVIAKTLLGWRPKYFHSLFALSLIKKELYSSSS